MLYSNTQNYLCANKWALAHLKYHLPSVHLEILSLGCTTWMLTRHTVKKLDSNCIRLLLTILNKSWRQHPTKQQLYYHLQKNSIQIRWTRHAGHYELISEILLWTPSHGRASVGWPAWTYLQQLCIDAGCSMEDLPKVMDK